MEKKHADVAVIGSGPGGYTAAIRVAQLGKSVILIEKRHLGGTCLNEGCIPSKTLLCNASLLNQIRRAAEYGITTGPVSFHYDQMKARKDAVVTKIRGGLEGLLKSNKITIVRGAAQFESPRELKVIGQDNLLVSANQIIIATGSIPLDVKAFPCDHKRILNSTSILEMTEAPKSLAIIGGGYIGCEFASLFSELNTKVTILESLPTILSQQGKDIAGFMTKTFTAKGVEIKTGVTVQSVQNQGDHVVISFTDGQIMTCDFCLVSVGRKAYSEGLHLEKAGLTATNKGFLETNNRMETGVQGIYAIGDIVGKWMLAHVASHQGIVAASNASGLNETMHYEAVPAVIFTNPEIATVGLNLESALQAGYQAVVGTFPFIALGKAQAMIDTKGFSQIIIDKQTGKILGATCIGHEASNLIGEMALAIQCELPVESIIETIHPHPTMAESWLEAALIAAGRPIHFPPKPKP